MVVIAICVASALEERDEAEERRERERSRRILHVGFEIHHVMVMVLMW